MLRLAFLLAATGSWLLFDATPGLNWGIFATLLCAAIVAAHWAQAGEVSPVTGGLALLATAFAWGAAATASEGLIAMNFLAACVSLALAVLARPGEGAHDLTIPRLLRTPFEAPKVGLQQVGRRLQGAVVDARREESLPALRGIAIAVPAVAVFGVALSAADPVFAAWRDGLARSLEDLPVGRTVFGSLVFLGSLGALGAAARGRGVAAARTGGRFAFALGSTERLIPIAATVALFACFLVLQVSYLFGNAPAVTGSGITFAEYARRGFGEITFVAVACTGLLVVLRGGSERPGDARVIRILELVLLVELGLLLASAYRRTLLYEEAYGYTVDRVWAQVFMVALGLGLVALGREITGGFDVHRLVRRQAAIGAAMLLGLTYWNHEGWIAARNIERFERTGRLDLTYIVRDLSMGAVPQALAAARRTGGARGVCADLHVRSRWARRVENDRWMEWNAAVGPARKALGTPRWYVLSPEAELALRNGRCGRNWSVG